MKDDSYFAANATFATMIPSRRWGTRFCGGKVRVDVGVWGPLGDLRSAHDDGSKVVARPTHRERQRRDEWVHRVSALAETPSYLNDDEMYGFQRVPVEDVDEDVAHEAEAIADAGACSIWSAGVWKDQ